MALKSYTKRILNYFSKMDIDKLHLCLKEYNYQDTTKEIFLNELNNVFDSLKKSGDTELLLYSGTCGSTINACPNCGNSGFRFVGNHSKDYIDFIFEIVDDDIKDICICHNFKTKIELENLGNSETIFIDIDDKITFNKTPEYWSKVNDANEAYLEIISSPPKTLDFQEICYWIDKHYFTDRKIGSYFIFEPRMKWTDFSIAYHRLNEIKTFIDNNLQQIIKENEFLEQINSEDELINWVIKQEDIMKGASELLLYYYIKIGEKYVCEKSNFIDLFGEVFDHIFNYIETFQKHNDEFCDKYKVYTFNECASIDNEREYNENNINLFSLSFQIQTRRELESQGIVIPYYLDKRPNDDNINDIEKN